MNSHHHPADSGRLLPRAGADALLFPGGSHLARDAGRLSRTPPACLGVAIIALNNALDDFDI
jgi:hypothetical protein